MPPVLGSYWLTRTSHQKEGLDFLVQRESLYPPSSRTLWMELDEHDAGRM